MRISYKMLFIVIAIWQSGCSNYGSVENQSFDEVCISEVLDDHTKELTNDIARKKGPFKDVPFSGFSLDSAQLFFRNVGGRDYLLFYPSSVAFIFRSNICEFEFKSESKRERIVLFWNSEGSCAIPFDIERKFSNVGSPKSGEQFAIATRASDSTIIIDYLFPEHVAALNKYAGESELENDSLFPRIFVWANW